MAIVIDQFPKRESQFIHAAAQPAAFDRCICTHIAAAHVPTKTWNLLGPCLRCDCKKLAVAA